MLCQDGHANCVTLVCVNDGLMPFWVDLIMVGIGMDNGYDVGYVTHYECIVACIMAWHTLYCGMKCIEGWYTLHCGMHRVM